MAKKKASDFRYNTGETKVPWAAVGENYNAEDLMAIVSFLMKGQGPEYEAALAEVSTSAKLIVFTEENLDEDGYINLESAKTLLLAHLASDDFDVLEGSTTPSEGVYNFSITIGEMSGQFIVDAITGVVCEGDFGDESYLTEEEDIVDILDPTAEDGSSAEEPTLPTETEPAQNIEEDPAFDPNATEPATEAPAEEPTDAPSDPATNEEG